ncbi:bacteriocin immunity protein [Pseudomonas sp. NPDC087346]|uniref:bacteriocin immunity protein n=1 Tax=Pseudomonas sp. NPDC087346 TaxID=3364438 RepID=UPI0037F29A42
MKLKEKLEEYTEREYLEIIDRLFQGRFPSEKQHDDLVEHIVITSEHPNGTGVLYYPEEGFEDSPVGVLEAIKIWRTANGKSGFKTEN